MNTRLTNILLIILLLFNLAFLATWWHGHMKMHRERKGNEPGTTSIMHDQKWEEEYLIKALNFDSMQRPKLQNLLNEHFAFLDKFMGAYLNTQSSLYSSLKNNTDSVLASKCYDSLGVLKVIMEKELFTHFNKIKSLCHAEQLPKFNALMDSMTKEFIQRHDFHHSENAKHDSF